MNSTGCWITTSFAPLTPPKEAIMTRAKEWMDEKTSVPLNVGDLTILYSMARNHCLQDAVAMTKNEVDPTDDHWSNLVVSTKLRMLLDKLITQEVHEDIVGGNIPTLTITMTRNIPWVDEDTRLDEDNPNLKSRWEDGGDS